MEHNNNSILIMSIWMFLIGYISISTILPKNTPFHLNKVFMSLQMVSLMIFGEFIMIKKYNYAILFFICFLILTYILKNQICINENEFLNGMIEHHEMALLMAENIKKKKTSTFTKNLANNILKSQQNQIQEMKNYIKIKKL